MIKTMCLCGTIRQMADDSEDSKVTLVASDLTKHLAAIRTILAKSKPLGRDVGYQVVPNNQRTMKILSVKAIDTSKVNQICSRFSDDIHGFWKASGDVHHAELLRRLACVSIFLRSKLDPQDAQVWASPHISSIIQGSRTSELRYAGKKYIKIARKLGGIGSLFWLPLDIPSST